MKSTTLIVIFAVSFVSMSCTEAFNPKGPFQDRLVVFAILTTVKDTQFVRLYRTYDPPGFNPLEHTTDNTVDSAQVSISTNSTVYQFQDTTIVREDKSRYTNDIRAYVAYPFPVVRGQSYTLDIQTKIGETVNANLTVPLPATVTISNSAALQNPRPFRDIFFTVNSRLYDRTRGFQVRVFLEYDILENGIYVRRREEIPTAVSNFIDCHTFLPAYHSLERRKSIQPERTTFDVFAYMAALAKIWHSNISFDVRMRQVVVELTEFDPALYSYANIMKGFRDEFSIRTDEPDYSNIPGGHGIFGVMTKQSLVVPLPDTTGSTLGCQNL
ncbi:MAG: DUF4249 domain-containing protein [Nitrososphaera sp.]|nr:DUF4249 domain-containing protein [Nitrososphaera sp.]